MDFASLPAPPTLVARNEPPLPKPLPPPACLVCGGHDGLINACRRNKDHHYCRECLIEAFDGALEDRTLFPAKCCTFFQLHTVRPGWPANKANQYREKLEEWLSPKKVYCPINTCSAFISQRKIPTTESPPAPPSLQDLLFEILQKIFDCEHSRFFRAPPDPEKTPDLRILAPNSISLDDMKENVLNSRYQSAAQLTSDMSLLATNTELYFPEFVHVVHCARNLYIYHCKLISELTDRLVELSHKPIEPAKDIFPCPQCCVAICTKCKQKAHPNKGCDNTTHDGAMAVLKQFGYKQCPRCGEGIKRMHGCSHVECRCRAHFCWYCRRSIDQCGGDCDEAGSDEDEDGDEDEGEDEHDEEMSGSDDDSWDTAQTRPTSAGATSRTDSLAQAREPTSPPGRPDQTLEAPRNLDGGGAARWADSGLDFGAEPEDPIVQVWSCNHTWTIYAIGEGRGDQGNLTLMECNRCFRPVSPDDASAWECGNCRLIVCEECKESF